VPAFGPQDHVVLNYFLKSVEISAIRRVYVRWVNPAVNGLGQMLVCLPSS